MAWQLIFTSAPRTLTAGQTGYGTVARSLDLRDALIQRLEQLSYFQHGAARAATPIVHAYRIVDVRGAKYHVLTRCVDAGLDFTNRTNHLAHHLVYTPEELAALPSPALIFQQWNGWRNNWAGDPRFLDAGDWVGFDELPRAATLPASEWPRLTGDAGRAASLLTRPAANGCFLACAPGHEAEWLALFAESLQLLDPDQKSPAQRWQFPFTTCLQEQDQPNDFRWRGCEPGSPVAQRAGSQIFAPADLPVPSGDLAELARRGPRRTYAAPSAPHVGAAPVFSAQPAAAKPEAPPARPLRLRGKGPAASGATARLDDDSHDETRRTPNSRRLAPVIGAVLLLVFLVTAFWQPGWLKPRREKPSAPAVNSNGSSKDRPDENLSPAGVVVVTNAEDFFKKPTNLKAGAAPKSNPSETALNELLVRLDSVPTYLFIQDFTKPLELTWSPRVNSLFARIMADETPVPESVIQCLSVPEVLCLSSPAAPKLMRVRVNKEEKHLRAIRENPDMEEFRLEFNDWFRDRTAAISFRFTEPPRASMSALFQPAGGGASFEPFRIMVVSDRAAPVPVQLSKTFLSADQTNFEDTVDARLRDKLKFIMLPPKARLQLRPFLGPRELTKEFDLPTAEEGQELNLHRARQELARRVTDTNLLVQKHQTEVARLKGEIENANAGDIELGRLLGHEGNHLVSFRAFVHDPKRKAGRMDHATFREYLHQVLKDRIAEAELKKLDQAKTRDEALKHFDAQLTQGGKPVPSNYFTSRWASLGLVGKFDEADKAFKAADKSLKEAMDTLARAPKDITGLSHVSLEVVEGSRRLELIRFTDAPERKIP